MSILPAAGHWQPVAAIGRALVQQGHDLLVVSGPSIRPWVENGGFMFHPGGIDMFGTQLWWKGRTCALGPAGLEIDGEPLFRAFNRFMVTEQAPVMLSDLVALIGEFGPDVVVHDSQESVGPVAATLTGLPHAMVAATCILPGTDGPEKELRALYGIPMEPRFPFLVLDRTPPSLRSNPLAALSPTAHTIRPVSADDAGPLGYDASVIPPPGVKPIIYASLGTTFSGTPGVLETVISGVGDGLHHLVITSVSDPRSLEPLPPQVTALPYLPQSMILPRADATVTHGGFNSVMGALTHGVPLVVIPLGADHFYNAGLVEACGAGVVLSRQALSPAAVATAVDSVLNEPRYRECARRVADEIAGMAGPEHAASLLERLAHERRPLVAAEGS